MAQLPAVQPSDLDILLRDKMEQILALIEAIAAEEQDTDLKLAEMLEGEPDQVRMAVVEKIRELLRERAAEKEAQMGKQLTADKKIEAERARNVFMQWLTWIMSEETLRKIREMFVSRPMLESKVKHLGHELAAFGVLMQQQQADKRELGGLTNSVPSQAQGQGKGTDKGRGS